MIISDLLVKREIKLVIDNWVVLMELDEQLDVYKFKLKENYYGIAT